LKFPSDLFPSDFVHNKKAKQESVITSHLLALLVLGSTALLAALNSVAAVGVVHNFWQHQYI
jgi:hypothetical protein